MATATWDRTNWPRATVTLEGGSFECVIDGIDGLEPQRTVSGSERARGLLSINPPTVRARAADDLIDLAIEAVDVAVTSTLGETGTPGDNLMLRYKTAAAVRGALEMLGVDA
jgi:hypothetical protein